MKYNPSETDQLGEQAINDYEEWLAEQTEDYQAQKG